MKKVILYGAGKRCEALCKILKWGVVEVLAILDSDSSRWGEEVDGIIVEAPIRMRVFRDVNICITVADISAVKKIRKDLKHIYEYDLNKEVGYHELILEIYKKNYKIEQKAPFQKIDRNKDNVMFDCYNGLGLGGVETWTIGLCKALLKKSNKYIYIITDNGVYNVADELKEHVINVDINHNEQFSISTVVDLVDLIIEKLPCKVITCTTNEVMLAAYLVKRYYPDMIQIISVIHNSNEKVYKEYMEFRECSDIYVGVSQDIKKEMMFKGIMTKNIYSIVCPFECPKILKRIYTEERSVPIHIGYAGRMDGMRHSQKRMDLLIKLIEILVKKDICFDFALAGDGVARSEMEEIVCSNHWEEKVHFLGTLEHSEMPNFWKEKDICINLADYEGRSISIIEAMGNGVVPIVTDTSGVNEDIIDDVNGYIVPLGDYKAAAMKIEYLEANRERLKELGKEAHDVVYPKSRMKPHLEFWEKILK